MKSNMNFKTIRVIPLGEVLEDRFELSRRYKLVEKTKGLWLLTTKCRDNYDSVSYIEYLKGKRDKPAKATNKAKWEVVKRPALKEKVSAEEIFKDMVE